MTGSLQVKHDKFYVVLSWYEGKKRKQKWIATGLPVKGNKRRAESILKQELEKLQKLHDHNLLGKDELFLPLMARWLDEVEVQYALQLDIIDRNPADRVILPKKQHKQSGTVYSAEQLQKLFEVFDGDVLETLVRLTATYGLRRSEVCGLRWEAIDFEKGTLFICHTAVSSKQGVLYFDTTKTRSSCRTLPLIGTMAAYLKQIQEKQRAEKAFLGDAYVDSGYVCVAADGTPLTPDAVSMHFRLMIRKSGLPYIRFHDLRHSVATLLHSVGRDIQDIQGWLGHSDISTTANIYSHLLYSAKRDMADSIEAALAGEQKREAG